MKFSTGQEGPAQCPKTINTSLGLTRNPEQMDFACQTLKILDLEIEDFA